MRAIFREGVTQSAYVEAIVAANAEAEVQGNIASATKAQLDAALKYVNQQQERWERELATTSGTNSLAPLAGTGLQARPFVDISTGSLDTPDAETLSRSVTALVFIAFVAVFAMATALAGWAWLFQERRMRRLLRAAMTDDLAKHSKPLSQTPHGNKTLDGTGSKYAWHTGKDAATTPYNVTANPSSKSVGGMAANARLNATPAKSQQTNGPTPYDSPDRSSLYSSNDDVSPLTNSSSSTGEGITVKGLMSIAPTVKEERWVALPPNPEWVVKSPSPQPIMAPIRTKQASKASLEEQKARREEEERRQQAEAEAAQVQQQTREQWVPQLQVPVEVEEIMDRPSPLPILPRDHPLAVQDHLAARSIASTAPSMVSATSASSNASGNSIFDVDSVGYSPWPESSMQLSEDQSVAHASQASSVWESAWMEKRADSRAASSKGLFRSNRTGDSPGSDSTVTHDSSDKADSPGTDKD
eukprot:TRINITY_DN11607_c0_g2_i1.p1 TRINITY_DN11607_c0_g2~~TRINITY_DN11607_c0_g2_i1.p1  ORF type:complete len:472 (-),score=117.86 TRINITY_DN11607_c0_g2_i1:579-1994(-)